MENLRKKLNHLNWKLGNLNFLMMRMKSSHQNNKMQIIIKLRMLMQFQLFKMLWLIKKMLLKQLSSQLLKELLNLLLKQILSLQIMIPMILNLQMMLQMIMEQTQILRILFLLTPLIQI